jgi:beta-lactamase regulating signal transducer with metallopeptidase domain
MTGWLLLPLAMSALFGLLAPRLARRLPPAVATWFLSGGAVLAAAASSVSFGLLALIFVAPMPVLVAQGHWSDQVLRVHAAQGPVVGAVATAAVVVFAARFVRVALRRASAVRDAFRLAAALADGDQELVVLDSAARNGLAVPGHPGRIVVTTALLRTLDAGERRALLAHERAHLAHRHYLHQTAAVLAAAVNPLLARLPAALELSCERWADEDAAHVCRRSTVAQALTHAATGVRPLRSAVVLAAAGADVSARLGALRAPAPRLVLWRISILAGLLTATTVAVAVAMHDTERLFELAQSAYRRSSAP